MTAKYYTLLTEVGAAKLANATALGVPLKLTHMAVGDGGGTLPTPNSKQVALVAEKRRAALNSLSIDPQNASQIIAEQVIPESEGGWWVREIGLFDDAGDLIAIGNCPESYKPQLAEGSGRTQTVRMVLITSSTDNITLKIDPSVVLATRGYVDNQIETRQQKSDVLTAMAGVKPAKGKLPYFTGDKAAAVADLSDFIRLMLNKGDAAGVLEYLQLRESFSGVVGATRNAMMNIATASATATFSADELIVEDSNGRQYRLSAFSKTINLATVGAGGMDTGTVPASGFIALYAIFNPATTTSSLLAVDATNSILPDVYGGASMPAGYTASSLVSVWRVAGSKLVAGNQVGRDISIEKQTALSSTAKVGALTALSIAAITPKNAKAVSGYTSIYSTNGAGGLVIDIASTSGGLGYISTGGYTGVAGIGANGQFSDLALITPQTMYYDINPLGTAVSSWSALIAISRYSI